MKILKFINSNSTYVEEYNATLQPIWCALFGPFYWMVRMNAFHAIVSIIPAFLTFGLSNIVYAFFANRINIKAYYRNGWTVKNFEKFNIKDAPPASFRPKFGWKLVLAILISGFIAGTALHFSKNIDAPSTAYEVLK